MIGEEAALEWLETRWILAAFGETEADAVEGYVRIVAESKGQPSPWEQLKHQVFLGIDAFVESMRRKTPKGRDLREIPQTKVRAATGNGQRRSLHGPNSAGTAASGVPAICSMSVRPKTGKWPALGRCPSKASWYLWKRQAIIDRRISVKNIQQRAIVERHADVF